MLYVPLKPDGRPILYIPTLQLSVPPAYKGDLAVDIRDLMEREVETDEVQNYRRNHAIEALLIWFPALTRPSIGQMEYWQSIGFDGVLLADFDDDGFRMLLCPDSFFAGIVFAERYVEMPDRVKLAAEVLNREYQRELLMVLDHEAPQSTEALSHRRAFPLGPH